MFKRQFETYTPKNEPVRPGASDHLKIPSLRNGERVDYTPPQSFVTSMKPVFNASNK